MRVCPQLCWHWRFCVSSTGLLPQACSRPCASSAKRSRDSGTRLLRWLRLRLPLAPAPARERALLAPARGLQGRAWGWRAWRAAVLRPGPWCSLAALQVLPRVAERPRLRQGSPLLGHARRSLANMTPSRPSAVTVDASGWLPHSSTVHAHSGTSRAATPLSCRAVTCEVEGGPEDAAGWHLDSRRSVHACAWKGCDSKQSARNTGAARRGASASRPAMTLAASVGHP